MKEKSQVADIDRSVYDIRDKEDDAYRMQEGLTPEIIDRLSKEKGDPVWMQQFRLQSLQIYNEMPIPDWGPSIEGLDMDHIATYVRPKTDMKSDWKDVPQDIKDTFERLGIPQAERNRLPASAPAVRFRARVPQRPGRSGCTGRRLHRHGERAQGRIRRYGAQVFHEARHTARP